VRWNAPAGATGTKWVVRCYNDAGYDLTIETTDLTCTFSGIDGTLDHTITVTAQGMTQSVSLNIEGLPPIEPPTQDTDTPQDTVDPPPAQPPETTPVA
jgi:hypothetical protein